MRWAFKSFKSLHHGGFRLSKSHYAVSCLAAISIVVGLLLIVRSGETPIKLNLSVSKVSFHTSAEMQPGRIDIPVQYAARQIQNIRLLESSSRGDGPLSIVAHQSSLRVSSVPIPPGAWVSIENHLNSGFSLNVKAKTDLVQVSGIQTDPEVSLLSRSGISAPLPFSETVNSISIGFDNASVPLAFSFEQIKASTTCKAEDLPDYFLPNIQNLPVDAISFSSEQSPSLSIFLSSLIGGVLKLEDVDKSIALTRGDSLKLRLQSAKILQLNILPCYITVAMDAYAREIYSGSGNKLTDLRPTYLEIAFKQPSVTFVVSCITALWGFLWGLKELFVPAKEK